MAIRALARLQWRLQQKLTTALDAEGIPWTFVKGAALRLTTYAPTDRCGLDLDIAVGLEHLDAATSAVRALGFLPAQWNKELRRFESPDVQLRRAVEQGHYELGFHARRCVVSMAPEDEAAIRRDLLGCRVWQATPDDRLECNVCVDIHHGLSFEIPSELALLNRVFVNRPEGRFPVLRPAWLAFHGLFKLYWEGVHAYETYAHGFVDLARLLPALDDDEADEFLDLIRTFHLEAGFFYITHRLQRDAGIELPATLLAFLSIANRIPAGPSPVEMNDMGDPWPKFWGRRALADIE